MQASTRPSVFRLFPSSTTYSPPLIHTGRVKRHAFINNTAKRSVRFCMFCMFMRVARFCFWELGLPSIWTMHNTWLFGVQTNPHCRWRLDWLSHFCIANGCAQRQIYKPHYVRHLYAVSRIYAPCACDAASGLIIDQRRVAWFPSTSWECFLQYY